MQIASWVRRSLSAAQQRALKKDLAFDIDVAEIVDQYDSQNGLCYWFNVPIYQVPGQPYHPLTPSLDRVCSDRGYVHGNVVWVCLAANLAKRDVPPDCWEEFLDSLRANLRR